MAPISDRDRAVFADAYVQSNFSDEELAQIGKLAAELKTILEAAKKRGQERMAATTH